MISACATQRFDIQCVLFPSSGKFIPDEILSGYDCSSDLAIDKPFDSIYPGIIERDAVNAL